MRKVLSALALFVFCCTVAAARPAGDARGNVRRVSRPAAATRLQPSVLQRLWKEFTGSIRTFDEEPPPPPPERVNSPVPG